MSTRVDTKKVSQGINEAVKHIEAAQKALAPFLVLLTAEERLTTLKPGDDAVAAAGEVAQRLDKPAFEAIVSTANIDLEAIREDVVNLEALARLAQPVAALVARLEDTKLAWSGEAYGGLLQGYSILKAHGETNAEVGEAIAPLTTLLAASRKRKKPVGDAGTDG
jgi:hypothetical protein